MTDPKENENEIVYFTEDMVDDYTILVPPMFPIHEKLLIPIMNGWGYHLKMMENSGEEVRRKGLKYCHNDTCYPAQVVIGEMMDVIESGEYDIHKIAFLITQTGGGCRASNYISLMRKALQNAGYSYIPIISFNFKHSLEQSGFKMPLLMLYRMLYCVYFGDLLMTLKNQCIPYEKEKGEAERRVDYWIDEIARRFAKEKNFSYIAIKKCYRNIVADFEKIPLEKAEKPKVGIVGEIFVKFSPYGNNELEKFLISNGAEPVLGGVADFCLYCVSNGVTDYKLYRKNAIKAFGMYLGLKILMKKQKDVINIVKKYSHFRSMPYFGDTMNASKEFISMGVKMGEGWLLTAEMLEFCSSGINNIICTQPFGCLPNHIVGKGIMKAAKEKYPDANIVAIDYDFSSTQTNQENRIKLMLANANKNLPSAE
ncbi:MAG: 2-hydroxyacyl-CoA dehydratase [Clostridiales bacterium]|nr:2-hydroxyacyl-CoA dehydratase [Clostridiales bacterium]